MLIAAAFGIMLPLLNRRLAKSPYAAVIPSASTVGLAFIIPPAQSLTLFYGTVLTAIWQRKNPESCKSWCTHENTLLCSLTP